MKETSKGNILFINGSPNKNGNTAKLAAELLKGKDYEALNLTDYTIGAYGQNLPGDGLNAVIDAIEPGGAPGADSEDFKAVLEKNIPVTMYFGDYIDNGDPAIQATMMWQAMRQACYDFRDAYNEQGGNCTVVDLPQEGITGNDHFMFQDLNNDVIADHIENWIQENAK